MKRVLFSGGGTGGHIYPALAIRELLLKRIPEGIVSAYLGLSDGMEATIVKRVSDLPFLPIRAQGMPRTLDWRWLTFPFVNASGIIGACRQIREFKPDLVIATGGYVAFPVLLAGRLFGVPTVIHEQNAAMGVTNRLFAGGAAKILLTYSQAWSGNSEKVVLTGNPVRDAFLNKNSAAGADSPGNSRFSKKPGEFWILSVGGSRGALSLNRVCIELVKKWLPEHPDVVLLQITGERDFDMVQKECGKNPRHLVLPYLHEMKEGFDVADVLVSRAGATILAEIACCGKPAILVPFPFATDNHQEKNARVLEQIGAARVILDADLTADVVGKNLADMRSQTRIAEMSEKMRSSRPPDVEDRIFETLKIFF